MTTITTTTTITILILYIYSSNDKNDPDDKRPPTMIRMALDPRTDPHDLA